MQSGNVADNPQNLSHLDELKAGGKDLVQRVHHFAEVMDKSALPWSQCAQRVIGSATTQRQMEAEVGPWGILVLIVHMYEMKQIELGAALCSTTDTGCFGLGGLPTNQFCMQLMKACEIEMSCNSGCLPLKWSQFNSLTPQFLSLRPLLLLHARDCRHHKLRITPVLALLYVARAKLYSLLLCHTCKCMSVVKNVGTQIIAIVLLAK